MEKLESKFKAKMMENILYLKNLFQFDHYPIATMIEHLVEFNNLIICVHNKDDDDLKDQDKDFLLIN